MIPSTFLSLHDITALKAVALQSYDTPLVLRVDGEHGTFQISLYFQGVGRSTVELMAEAINGAITKAANEL